MPDKINPRVEEEDAGGMSLADMIDAVFRHKLLAFSVFCLVVLGALIFSSYRTDAFASYAKIKVVSGSEQRPVDVEITDGPTPYQAPASTNAVEILKSHGLAEAVVRQLGPEVVLGGGPDDEPLSTLPRLRERLEKRIGSWLAGLIGGEAADREAQAKTRKPLSPDEPGYENLVLLAVTVVTDSLHVDTIRGSDVVKISYEASHPQVARSILRGVVDAFMERYRELMLRDDRQVDAVAQRFNQAKRRHEEAREALTAAELQIGWSNLEERETALGAAQSKLEGEIAASQGRIEGLQEQIRVSEELLSGRKVVSGELVEEEKNPEWEKLQDRLHQLRVDLARLRVGGYTDKHPQVISLKEQIRLTEELAAKTAETISKPKETPENKPFVRLLTRLEEMKVSLPGLEKEHASLLARREPLAGQLAQLNEDRALLGRLRDEEEQAKAALEAEAAHFERIQAGAELAAEPTIFEHPTLALWPEGTRRRTIVLIAALLGLLAGLGAAVVRDMVRRSFKNAREVEEWLGVPAVGTLPEASRRNLARLPRV